MSTEPGISQTVPEPVRARYVLSHASVEGASPRNVRSHAAKYSLSIAVDGHVKWKSRVIKTKESKVVWDTDGDRYEFECAPTSVFEVVLYLHRHVLGVEELGRHSQPLASWLDNSSRELSTEKGKEKRSTSLSVNLEIRPKDSSSGDNSPGAAVDEADDAARSMRQLTVSVADMEDEVEGGTKAVSNNNDLWKMLLSNLEVFVNLMDSLTEVHPYAKMAWTVLSAAYKAVKAQQTRDNQIIELVEKMKTTYAILLAAEDLKKQKGHAGVLSRLSMQTIECGHFITSYAKDKRFADRLLKHSLSHMKDKINDFSSSFDKLLEEFRGYGQINTEINTMRILDDLKVLGESAVEFALSDIPYAGGAAYERSKQCLDDTRTALLDEITEWANSAEDDTPQVYVLLGLAGSGKSTIAHTMAARFDKMKRLGASFCFSRSYSKARKPENIFRNIARDLASLDSTFKIALCNEVGGYPARCTSNDVEQQFEDLVLAPAQTLAMCGTVLFVIDGLDESGTPSSRKDLLSVLAKRLDELPAGFRFLITSREEQDIHELFPCSTSAVRVRHMPTLRDDERLEADILTFIERQLKDKSGKLPVGLPQSACASLTARSEGLFQWASAACTFITERRMGHTPLKRYEALKKQNDVGLDGLYIAILAEIVSPAAVETFKAIMGLVLTVVEPLCMHSLQILMDALAVEGSVDVRDYLQYLGSVLSGVAEETAPIRPLHTSFAEFLRSSLRAPVYNIGMSTTHHEKLTIASLRLLRRSLHFNMGGLDSSHRLNPPPQDPRISNDRIAEDVSYACRYWGYHLSKCPPGVEYGVFNDVCHLLKEKFLFWLDALSILGVVHHAASCLSVIVDRLQISEELPAIAQDGIRFLRAFAHIILSSSAHLYLSVMLWTPTESAIFRIYAPKFRRKAHVVSGSDRNWPRLEVVISHTLPVYTVAFGFGSRYIASGCLDGGIRIWDADTIEPVGEPLIGHEGPVTSVQFSLDRKWIVSGSEDWTVRIWDAETRAAVREPLVGHEDKVTSVVFSVDGRQIASGSGDRTVRIWDVETGAAVGQPFAGHSAAVTSVAFSPDGRRIASASEDMTVRIWDAKTSAHARHLLVGHEGSVSTVAFSPDGTRLVSGSHDRTMRIWDAEKGVVIGEPLMGHDEPINSVTFSPDGKQLVSGSADCTVRLWDAVTGAVLGEPLLGHRGSVRSVAFSPNGMRIVSGSDDGSVRIWDAETNTMAEEPEDPVERVRKNHHDSHWPRKVAFSPDGMRIFCRIGDGTIKVFTSETGIAVDHMLCGDQSWVEPPVVPWEDTWQYGSFVESLEFSADGKLLVSGSRDHIIRIWDAEAGTASQRSFGGHEGWVTAVAVSLDGTRIISGSNDGTLRIWNAEMGATVDVEEPPFGEHDWRATTKRYLSDGSEIMSGSGEQTARVWNFEAGEEVEERARTGRKGSISVTWMQLAGNRKSLSFDYGDCHPRRQGRAVVSSLSLSPSPDQQLTQQYKPSTQSSDADPVRISIDFGSGWIIGNKTDYLMWIPPNRIRRLYTGQHLVVIPGPTIHVDLRDFPHGTRWTECWQD